MGHPQPLDDRSRPVSLLFHSCFTPHQGNRINVTVSGGGLAARPGRFTPHEGNQINVTKIRKFLAAADPVSLLMKVIRLM